MQADLDMLVSRLGVVSDVWPHPGTPARGRLPVHWYQSTVGSALPGVGREESVTGSGMSASSADHARLVAVAEAAERYAGADHLGEHRIRAAARDLEGECLEPYRYPRCSPAEYAHPSCPVVEFDPHAEIRWTRGWDLATSEPVWIPARMACYSLRPESPAENYLVSISTGNAVHADPVEAVLRGLLEVIERDAIAVSWLQRLPLPLVDERHTTPVLDALVRWNHEGFVDTYVFDATTDLGVPTAVCVLAADRDERACRAVGAGTGRTMEQAAVKAVTEAIGVRELLRDPAAEPPADLADFADIADGARYMGRAGRAHAFGFLLDGADRRPRRPVPPLPGDPADAVAAVVGALTGKGMRPVVVDRTPMELAAAGLTAVCAVVADLQPMSIAPLAQFKGHRRLYEAPASMGFRVLEETELNPWPQPVA